MKTISEILNKYSINNPLVQKELEDLFSACISASKEYGRRVDRLTNTQEVGVWNRIYQSSVDRFESDNSQFAMENYKELLSKYRIVLRKPK